MGFHCLYFSANSTNLNYFHLLCVHKFKKNHFFMLFDSFIIYYKELSTLQHYLKKLICLVYFWEASTCRIATNFEKIIVKFNVNIS